MKTTEWKARIRALAPASEWTVKGRQLFVTPLGWALRGVMSETSGFSKGTYLWRVEMPLFIPTDVVDLSWSQRIRPGMIEDVDVAGFDWALRAAMASPAPDAEVVARIAESTDHPNTRFVLAAGCACILTNELPRALSALDSAATAPIRYEWEILTREHGHTAAEALRAGGVGAGRELLGKWRAETIRRLRLEPSQSP